MKTLNEENTGRGLEERWKRRFNKMKDTVDSVEAHGCRLVGSSPYGALMTYALQRKRYTVCVSNITHAPIIEA